jgi:hypothetical protein
LHGGPERLPLDPVLSLPGEENENRDKPRNDKHPVLAVETKKRKMLSENLHALAPPSLCRISGLFEQDKGSSGFNILFLYFRQAAWLVHGALRASVCKAGRRACVPGNGLLRATVRSVPHFPDACSRGGPVPHRVAAETTLAAALAPRMTQLLPGGTGLNDNSLSNSEG